MVGIDLRVPQSVLVDSRQSLQLLGRLEAQDDSFPALQPAKELPQLFVVVRVRLEDFEDGRLTVLLVELLRNLCQFVPNFDHLPATNYF